MVFLLTSIKLSVCLTFCGYFVYFGYSGRDGTGKIMLKMFPAIRPQQKRNPTNYCRGSVSVEEKPEKLEIEFFRFFFYPFYLYYMILYDIKGIMRARDMDKSIYYIKDVEEIVNRNRLTLRRWWEQGVFPEPILIAGNNRLAWKASVINEWIEKQFEQKLGEANE